MANQKYASMTINVPGVEVIIWYNDVNLRIGTVEWIIPEPGIAAHVQIWDSNVDPEVPVIDRTVGQGSGAELIPGNYRLVEVEDDYGTYLSLPDNITYRINIQTLG
jgi:hypothetical protein